MYGDLKILSGTSNEPLAKAICEHLGCQLERIAPVPPEYRVICAGAEQKCRYIWRIPRRA